MPRRQGAGDPAPPRPQERRSGEGGLAAGRSRPGAAWGEDLDDRGAKMLDEQPGGEPCHERGARDHWRSDDRIREEVGERLKAAPDLDAAQVAIEVKRGEVTIEGAVETRWTKRAAVDCLADIPGIRRIHDRLRVEPIPPASDPSNDRIRGPTIRSSGRR